MVMWLQSTDWIILKINDYFSHKIKWMMMNFFIYLFGEKGSVWCIKYKKNHEVQIFIRGL